jgi:hypothetical protein
MYAKPIHAELKPLYNAIALRGKDRAGSAFRALQKQLIGKSHLEQLILLEIEDAILDGHIAEFEHPYYTDY